MRRVKMLLILFQLYICIYKMRKLSVSQIRKEYVEKLYKYFIL